MVVALGLFWGGATGKAGELEMQLFGGEQLGTPISGTAVQDLLDSGAYPNNFQPIPLGDGLKWGVDEDTDLDQYGSVVEGYLEVPVTGEWTIMVSSDDASQLEFNPTGPEKDGAEMITEEPACCVDFPEDPDPSMPQVSEAISLEKGTAYYFRLVHKEGGGGDFWKVGWVGPGLEEPTIIGPQFVQPFVSESDVIEIVAGPQDVEVEEGGTATFTPTVRVSRPAELEWELDGEVLEGESNSSLMLEGLTADDAGTLTFRVTNEAGSSASAQANLTVIPDETPPLVTSARPGILDPNIVEIMFDEPVEEASASDANNYTFDQRATVESVQFGEDGASVVLMASGLEDSVGIYELTVDGVRDRSAAMNPTDNQKVTVVLFGGEKLATFNSAQSAKAQGWVEVRSRDNAEDDFGFSDTNNNGLGAGEAGGAIQRGGGRSYYADVFAPSPDEGLTLEDEITAGGFFHVVKGQGNNRIEIGHTGSESPNHIGFAFSEPSSPTAPLPLYYQIGLANGDLDEDNFGEAPSGTTVEWEYEYDPEGGEEGHGALMIRVGEVETTVELTEQQREVGATFDAFGLVDPGLGGSDEPGIMFFDNLSYTTSGGAGLVEPLPDARIEITQQPQDQTAFEEDTATFSVEADAFSGDEPVERTRVTWFRDEQPAGAGPSFETDLLTLEDDGATFKAVIQMPGARVISDEAVLSVQEDSSSPELLRRARGNPNRQAAQLTFEDPRLTLDSATATDTANYAIEDENGNPLSVNEVTLGSDGLSVTLSTDQQSVGSSYTVTVNNVADTRGNAIAPDSQATFFGLGNVSQRNDGVVSVEAENFSSKIMQGGQEWLLKKEKPGFSGTGYMQSLPDQDVNNSDPEEFLNNSPRIDFEVEFQQSGTHYVWVRGSDADGDSIHLGLNGEGLESSIRITGFGGSFDWANDRQGPSEGTPFIEVPAAGTHTVNAWMREDGFQFDKFVLVPEEAFTPSGLGPPETREGAPPLPEITLTTPAQVPSGEFELTADASTDVGSISKVEFFIEGEKVGEASSAPYAVTVSGVEDGFIMVRAEATNDLLDTGVSSDVRIQVGELPSPVPQSVVEKSESFESQESAALNGWVGLQNRDAGQDFGFSDTADAGGSPGEAGGTFKRNAPRHMYVDVFPGRLTLDDAFSASGQVVMPEEPGDAGVVIGHSDSSLAGEENESNAIGLVPTEGPRFFAQIMLANGERIEGAFVNPVEVGAVYDWEYTYEPNGGASGSGALTVTVTHTETEESFEGVQEMTEEQRKVGATFDSFGLTSRALSDSDEFLDAFVDNITYTVPLVDLETFDTAESAGANGWVELQSREAGQDFGFSDTDNAGGPAGEAGGHFKRNATRHMYVDVFEEGTLDLDDAIWGRGNIVMTSVPTGNAGTVVGHSNSTLVGEANEANVIGLTTVSGPRLFSHMVLANGERIEEPVVDPVEVGTVYEYIYRYRPNGGEESNGSLTVTVENLDTGDVFEDVRVLTEAQRSVGATFDSFGLTSRALSDQEVFSDSFVDNAAYTVPLAEPEVPELVFEAAAGQLTLQWEDAEAVLQRATAVTGPYEEEQDAGSPYEVDLTGSAQGYFRLVK